LDGITTSTTFTTMSEKVVTIKVYEASRKKLRVISAMKEESHQDTIERLLRQEQKRIDRKSKKNG
jgi:hypothetical protein